LSGSGFSIAAGIVMTHCFVFFVEKLVQAAFDAQLRRRRRIVCDECAAAGRFAFSAVRPPIPAHSRFFIQDEPKRDAG
jgi:hypothetical protein